MITRSFVGPAHYVHGVKFTSHIVEDDLYAKPIQGRHYDTLIMDDIDKQEQGHMPIVIAERPKSIDSKLSLGYSIRELFKEPQMSRGKRKVLKNKPSTKVNEVKVEAQVISDLEAQRPKSPLSVENTYGVEPTNFHARLSVGRGAAKLIEAAEEYETLARLLRNTANTLNRIHQ